MSTFDHKKSAVSRLHPYLRGKPKVEALLKASVDELNSLEESLAKMLEQRGISAGVGEQLNIAGRILNRRRGLLLDDLPWGEEVWGDAIWGGGPGIVADVSDDDYRRLLELERAIYRAGADPTDTGEGESEGNGPSSVEAIYSVARLLLQPPIDHYMQPYYPAKIRHNWLNPPIASDAVAWEYANILRRATAAAVGLYVFSLVVPLAETFCYAGPVSPELPWGDETWGDDVWGGGGTGGSTVGLGYNVGKYAREYLPV